MFHLNPWKYLQAFRFLGVIKSLLQNCNYSVETFKDSSNEISRQFFYAALIGGVINNLFCSTYLGLRCDKNTFDI